MHSSRWAHCPPVLSWSSGTSPNHPRCPTSTSSFPRTWGRNLCTGHWRRSQRGLCSHRRSGTTMWRGGGPRGGGLPQRCVFERAASVHESATAEIALALVLAAQRGIPDFVRDGVARRWAPRWHAGLADRRVLLIGHGGVGTAIAERLRPFEVTITRVAQSARHDEFGAIHPTSELAALLPDADIVIVAVPLTSATSGLIDAQFLALL